MPDFIAPTRHRDAAQALAQIQRIYAEQTAYLRQAMQAFVAGDTPAQPVRACYPFVRLQTSTLARAPTHLAFGFVQGRGRYETPLTRPDLFAHYYLEQFELLLHNHGVELEVGTSTQPVPVYFALDADDALEGSLDRERRLLLRDLFDLPDLTAMDDGIANGTWQPRAGEAQPLSLFTAPRVDYSLQRLRHYTGTRPSGSRISCCSPTTSSTSTNSCAWGMPKCRTRAAATTPSSSLATSSRAAWAWAPRRATSWAVPRRGCRRCPPTTS